MSDPVILLPHQTRVVRELEDLDDKLTKLFSFVGTPMFNSLDSAEQERLRRQHSHMSAYAGVLRERIANF